MKRQRLSEAGHRTRAWLCGVDLPLNPDWPLADRGSSTWLGNFPYGCGSKPMVYFSGDWDVHWAI